MGKLVDAFNNKKVSNNNNTSSSAKKVGKLGKSFMESKIGLDTLDDDLKALGTTIEGIYTGWQPQDTMNNTKASIVSMQERLNAYQEYAKLFGGEDVTELANGYKSVLDDWDNRATMYGQYKNADAYNVAYKNVQLEKQFSHEDGSGYTFDEVQAELKKYAPDSDEYKYLSAYTNYSDLNDFNKAMESDGVKKIQNQIATLKAEKAKLDSDYKANGGWMPSASNYNRPAQNQVKPYQEWQAKSSELEKKIEELESAGYYGELKTKKNLRELDHKVDLYKPEYEGKADFEENSKYVTTYNENQKTNIWTGSLKYEDLTYEYINNVNGARDEIQMWDEAVNKNGNGYESEWQKAGYDLLREDEIAIYNYKYKVEGKDSADKFLEDMQTVLDKRRTDELSKSWEQNAEKMPILSNAASVILKPAGALVGTIDDAVNAVQGKDYNPYSYAKTASNYVSDTRKYTGEDIAESTKDFELFGQNVPSFLYNTGMSIADSAYGVATFGKFNSLLMGTSAYQEKAKEMVEAGADQDVVWKSAITSGVAETLFEHIGIDNLFKIKNVDSLSSWVKNALKQAGAEGAEEIGTEITNIIADDVIRGKDSELYKMYSDLIERGYSESEALSKTALQAGSQVAWAGIGGALSGAVMGGVAGANNYANNKSVGKEIRGNERVTDMLNIASLSPQESHALAAYTEYANRGVNADNITDAQLGNLYGMADADARGVLASKKATTEQKADAETTLNRLAKTKTENKVAKVANELSQTDEEGVVTPATRETIINEQAKGMSEAEANLFRLVDDGHSNAVDYADSFNLVVAMAQNEYDQDYILEHRGVLSTAQVNSIYQSVVTNPKMAQQKRLDALIQEQGDNLEIKGKVDDSVIDYGNTGAKGKVNWNDLHPNVKATIAYVTGFSTKVAGMDVQLVTNGRDYGFTGQYDRQGNTMLVDITALTERVKSADTKGRKDNARFIVSTVAHEVTHWMEEKAPELYAQYDKMVMDALTANGRSEADVLGRRRALLEKAEAKRAEKENRKPREITDKEVRREVVARASEDMLALSEEGKKFFESLSESEQKQFVGKIKEVIRNIKEWIKNVLSNLTSNSPEAVELRLLAKDLDAISKKWDEMLRQAAKANAAMKKAGVNDKAIMESKASDTQNSDIDNYIQRRDNLSRANEEGDFINEFHSALSGAEWRRFYNVLVRDGHLQNTRVGTIASVVIDDKLVIAERQYMKEEVHDYVVCDVFRIENYTGSNYALRVIEEAIKEGDITYDTRTIYKKLHQLLERTFSPEILSRFDGDSLQYVVGVANGKNRANNGTIHGNSQAGTSGTGLSLGNQSGVQGNNGVLSEDTNTANIDAEYMKAVESGDVDTVQRMVDDAAKKAGYTIKAYHGTKSQFTVFDDTKTGNNYGGWSATGRAFDFVKDESRARLWGAKAHGANPVRVIPAYLKANKTFYTYAGKVNGELEAELPNSLSTKEKADIMSLGTTFKNYLENELGVDFVGTLQGYGYDSISMHESDDNISVFSTTQIKSADPITYDDNGNIIPLSKRFDANNDDIRYSDIDTDGYAPTFYSYMGKTINEIKQDKIGANSVVSYLKGKGVKDEEIKWSGIEAWLDGKKSVTKAELQEFVAGSMLQIEENESIALDWEVVYDDEGNYKIRDKATGNIIDEWVYDAALEDGLGGYVNNNGDVALDVREIEKILHRDQKYPRWNEYKLDGGSNYRELTFKLQNSTYSNSAMRTHWGNDAEGVLASARIQDFDVNGQKMLFIEEIQSDWHNEGHKKGYREKGDKTIEEIGDESARAYREFYDTVEGFIVRSGESANPALLANLFYGEKDAYDFLRENYTLSEEQMRYIDSEVAKETNRRIETENAPSHESTPDAPFRNNYHEYVLKRLIRMAAEQGYDSVGWTTAKIQSERWSDEFAEGYRIEYDQDIPKFLRKYGKKWGVTVGKTKIQTSQLSMEEEMDIAFIDDMMSDFERDFVTGKVEVWSMPITDSMKDSVLYEGQVMYSDIDEDSDGVKLSTAQQEYFKDSKVRDENGKLKVVYHGSRNDFTAFDMSMLKDDLGIFFAETSNGKQYGDEKAYYLAINNPLIVHQGKEYADALVTGETQEQIRNRLIKEGYDGVKIMYNRMGGGYIVDWVAFYSEQAKLTSNKKPSASPDVRYSDIDELDDLNAQLKEKQNQIYSASMELKKFDSKAAEDKLYAVLKKDGASKQELDDALQEYAKWGEESGYAGASAKLSALKDEEKLLRREIQKVEDKLHDELKEQIAHWDDEDVKKYVAKAVRKYHTTTRLDKASYLVTTGSMLDFSDGQGYRVKDHREISEILDLPDYAEYSDGMIAFMNMGNIRLQTYGIDVSAMPNAKQFSALRDIISTVMRENDEFSVDFSKTDGYSAGSVTYGKGTSASKIIADIKSYFETGVVPEEQSSIRDFLYSDIDPEVDIYEVLGENKRLQKENKKLHEDFDRLMERLKLERQLTHGNRFNENQLDAVAGHIRNLGNSNYSKPELVKKLREVYTYLATSNEVTWDDLFARLYGIAEDVLGEARPVYSPNDYYANIYRDLRSMEISLSDEQKKYFKDMMGVDSHKAFFGKIKVSDKGIPLNSKWEELAGKYPNEFAETNDKDQVLALLDIYETAKELKEVVEEYDVVERTRWLANEIYNQYWNVSAIRTTADRYDKQIKRLNYEHHNTMKELRDSYNERLEKQKKADRAERSRIFKKLREDHIKELQEIRRTGKERLDKYKEEAARKTRIHSITANSLTLNEWLVKNSKDKHIHESMKGPVIALLQAIDFSSKRALGMRGGDMSGVPTNKDISLQKALSQVKDMMAEASVGKEELVLLYGHELDADIKAMVESVDDIMRNVGDNEFILNKMTLNDLITLDNVVKTIKHAVTNMNKFHTVHHAKGIANLAQEEIVYAEKIGEEKVYDEQSMKSAFKKLVKWTNVTPYYAFKRFGTVGQKIFEAVQDGWDKLAFNVKQIIDFTLKAYKSEEVRTWEKELHEFDVLVPATDSEKESHDYKPKYQKVQMTTAQVMNLYLLNKREAAKKHLLGGGIKIKDITIKKGKPKIKGKKVNFTQDQIDKIVGSLTPRQIEVADALSRFMNTTASDWGNEVSMARFGIKMFSEKAYVPMQVDKSNINSADPNDQNNSLFKMLNMSFTKGLTEGANNRLVVSSIFDVFAQHTSDMAKYNALALPVLDAFRWYNYSEKAPVGEEGHDQKSVKDAIETAFGKDGLNYITTFLEDLNGARQSNRDPLAVKFFKTSKLASVGFNLRVVLLQPTSYFRASAVINHKYLASALLHTPKTQKRGMERAEKYCGMALWKSLGYFDTNIQKGMTEQIKHDDGVYDKWVERSMKLAGAMDKVTLGVLWNAAEQELKSTRKDLTFGSEEFFVEVGKRLRDIIYATQVVDSTVTRSEMMRSPDTGNKILTTFASEPTLAYNMLADAYFQTQLDARELGSKKAAIKKNSKHMARVFTAYTVTNLVAALVESGFDVFRDDDDEEMDLAEFMKAYLGNFAADMSIVGKLPYLKDGLSIVQGYSPSRSDLQWMQSAYYTGKGIAKHLEGEGNPVTTIKNGLKTISYLSGLGFYNAYRDFMATLHALDILTAEEFEELLGEFVE